MYIFELADLVTFSGDLFIIIHYSTKLHDGFL